MIFTNFKKFILRELIFPKTLIVDYPGVIINNTIRRFGKGNVRTRTSYYFEDIYSNLYLDSLREMGKEEADLLWYKIGKDSSLRYLLFLGDNKFSDNIVGLVLEHCLNTIRSTGFSFSGSFSYDSKKKFLKISGGKNVICRKTGSGSLVAGIVAGIMTYFQRENFEAEAFCGDCSNFCIVKSCPEIEMKYFPNIEELRPMKNYASLNFSFVNSSKNFNSFGDLVKFNKIYINNDESKIFFLGKAVLTSEIGLGELFLKNYIQIGKLDLFERSVIKSSEVLFKDLTENEDLEYKLKFVSNLISGFGWGIPHFKKRGNVVILFIVNPLRTRYGVSHIKYIINGFLNQMYGKNFKIKKSENQEIIFEC
ncbi:hypothetical protein J4226_02255 [Candidatus Pacearchaeota archaeon]|nr:hypothetical protein [Candidatus Pacearchaeota archaeon]